tara:strand:- start:5451 stop:5906 length:456 start_codon:yes stop_codon:yes gene_type:complete
MTHHKLRALIVLVLPVIFGFGPCGPIAGGQLSDPEVSGRITDFRFVQDENRCALEVTGDKVHSVTVNCWAVGKQLFIGCQDCAGKTWSSVIETNPLARVRIGPKVYPVKATRMHDPVAIERAWRFRLQKYDEGEPGPVPEGYWLFHMGSRG